MRWIDNLQLWSHGHVKLHARYISITQDHITPRPTNSFGSTCATNSLSHRTLTTLVTPYLHDHCWQHRCWNLTLVYSTRSLPDHCTFYILQYTYATQRCTHAWLATFYLALLYEILSTQQSWKLSPYHTPRDRSTPDISITSQDSHPQHYTVYCYKRFSSSYSLVNKTVRQTNEILLKL